MFFSLTSVVLLKLKKLLVFSLIKFAKWFARRTFLAKQLGHLRNKLFGSELLANSITRFVGTKVLPDNLEQVFLKALRLR